MSTCTMFGLLSLTSKRVCRFVRKLVPYHESLHIIKHDGSLVILVSYSGNTRFKSWPEGQIS